jgi:polyhydroxyalkanoate synthesis repressor PhaR
VTLEDLAAMVREGTEFVVYDAKTNDDLTRQILTQIIFEEESRGEALLPVQFLRQLIGFYGGSMQGVLPSYLEMSLANFGRQQEQFASQMSRAFGTGSGATLMEEAAKANMAMFERAMQMFPAFGYSRAEPVRPRRPIRRMNRRRRPARRRPGRDASPDGRDARPDRSSGGRVEGEMTERIQAVGGPDRVDRREGERRERERRADQERSRAWSRSIPPNPSSSPKPAPARPAVHADGRPRRGGLRRPADGAARAEARPARRPAGAGRGPRRLSGSRIFGRGRASSENVGKASQDRHLILGDGARKRHGVCWGRGLNASFRTSPCPPLLSRRQGVRRRRRRPDLHGVFLGPIALRPASLASGLHGS